MREEKSNNTEYTKNNPKPLPLELIRRGFIYSQIWNEPGYYIYELRVQESDLIIGYDVFREKIKDGRYFRDKLFHTKIAWPNDEAFGSWAWSCNTLSSALDKLCECKQKANSYGKKI